ncbi:hypothetical protein SUDANB120_05040 [Streptomyces sp. enrichment culture]|nr:MULTISPECIES: hypothetical protein [Streptomyces]GGT13177.1 hypothetical protein GCM10010286_43610 [Streptomyces toxytricini]
MYRPRLRTALSAAATVLAAAVASLSTALFVDVPALAAAAPVG